MPAFRLAFHASKNVRCFAQHDVWWKRPWQLVSIAHRSIQSHPPKGVKCSRNQPRTATKHSTKITSHPTPSNTVCPHGSADVSLVNAPAQRGRDDDALARYPTLRTPGGILRGLDYAGTLTFAVTGSITAAQSGLDVFGCALVSMVTAVGGGTLRDAIVLGKRPFWTEETEYIWMSVLTGIVTFFAWPFVLDWKTTRMKDQQQNQQEQQRDDAPTKKQPSQEPDKNDNYDFIDAIMDTLDAIGLSAFAIIGAQNGIRAGMPMVVSAICGMATSTFGGMIRDIVCSRPVRIARSNAELYAPPALAGAVTYLVAKGKVTASPGVRIGSAFAVCMGSRYFAVKHDMRLHTWDTREDGLGVAVRKTGRLKD